VRIRPTSVREYNAARDYVELSGWRDGGVGATGGALYAAHTFFSKRDAKSGMQDHYCKRNPRCVAKACEAVEMEYSPWHANSPWLIP
jgi:hypothetical protein